MKRARSFASVWFLVPAAFAAYAATLLAWLVIPSVYVPQQPFEPYVTVLTDLGHEAAAARLRRAGAHDVLSPATTDVVVSRFSHLETLSLDAALETLDPLDPRRDPWIEGLHAYFHVGGRNAVYARFGAPLALTDRIVRRALGSESRVAEWSPFRTAGALALFTALCALAAAAYAGRRTTVAVIAAPFLPAVVTAGLPGAAASGAIVLLLAWSAEEVARIRLSGPQRAELPTRVARARLAMTAAAVILSLVYLGRIAGAANALPLVVATAGAASGLVAVLAKPRGRADPEHRPFVPVSIIARSAAQVVGRTWVRLGLLALPLLLVVPPLLDAVVPGGIAARPIPQPVRGDGLGPEALRVLWYGEERGALPDLADYLAHRAFQEGLVYGRPYGFPETGETVELTRFREQPDGSYSSYREAVLVYDDEWVSRALESAPSGITSMLVGLGRAAGVVLSPSDTIYSGYSQFLQHLAYVVLVLAPFLLAALPWSRPARARDPVLELARRRRQVA